MISPALLRRRINPIRYGALFRRRTLEISTYIAVAIVYSISNAFFCRLPFRVADRIGNAVRCCINNLLSCIADSAIVSCRINIRCRLIGYGLIHTIGYDIASTIKRLGQRIGIDAICYLCNICSRCCILRFRDSIGTIRDAIYSVRIGSILAGCNDIIT